MKAPFPIDEFLTGIAIAYRNNALIADEVLPRVSVGKQEFVYKSFTKEDRFTVPNTRVGRTGLVNQIEFGATEVTDSTVDYGLEDPIPFADVENAAGSGIDPVGNAVEGLADLIALDREVRVANLVMAAANYPTANKITLSGTSQWTDTTNSNPISVIQAGLDVPIMRPNIMVLGRAAWRSLSEHPKIQKAVHGNDGDTGIARRAQIAELFELEQILVGEGFVNTAKKGQTPVFARVWGDSVALLHRNRLATNQRGITFGATFQWGGRVAGQLANPKIGLRGGVDVRVGESVVEKIVASDVGYLISDTNA